MNEQTDHFRVRDVTPDDLPRIRRINDGAIPAVNEIPERMYHWAIDTALAFRLVESQGQIAGFVLALPPGLPYESLNYTWFCRNYDHFCYIDRLAIAPQWHRRGFASALYRDVIGTLGSQVSRFACEVNVRPLNEPSLAFHRHLGFHEVGQQDTDDGAKRVALMVREQAA